MAKETDKNRTVRLHTSSMVDPISDWSLGKLVAHQRKQEKDKEAAVSDSRIFGRSSIRFLGVVLDEVAAEVGAPRGSTTRWLTYHGLEIILNSQLTKDIQEAYSALRKKAIENDDPDMADIINNVVPYSPGGLSDGRVTYRVYPWVHDSLEELAQVCGVSMSYAAQVALVRSLLTADLPSLERVGDRLRVESGRWDKWMRYRLGTMDLAVSVWLSSTGGA